MQYPHAEALGKTASNTMALIRVKIGEVLPDRRDVLMGVGALAIGALAFFTAAQATVADDDYDDDDGYYHIVWGGGYFDDDDWGVVVAAPI
ncbi:MAG TPA: hypothetical protein VHG52_13935, partial [Thermomicrobiales bacterium]|nr:hypothetical protein [Thermomicrobiales bacterium]